MWRGGGGGSTRNHKAHTVISLCRTGSIKHTDRNLEEHVKPRRQRLSEKCSCKAVEVMAHFLPTASCALCFMFIYLFAYVSDVCIYTYSPVCGCTCVCGACMCMCVFLRCSPLYILNQRLLLNLDPAILSSLTGQLAPESSYAGIPGRTPHPSGLYVGSGHLSFDSHVYIDRLTLLSQLSRPWNHP